MIRRAFIDKMLSLLSGVFLLPIKSIAMDGEYIIISKNGREMKIPYIVKRNMIYISLVDFTRGGDYGHYTNEEKRKTVIYIGPDKIKFTADNTFVIINESIFQMLYEPFWKNMEIWVPAVVLADIISRNTAHTMQFDASKKVFSVGMKDVNISGLQIEEKSNGSLIQLYSTKNFAQKDISLKLVREWLYVEIYGAKVDTTSLNRKYNSGLVSEVKVAQFDQSASIGFKLRQKDIKRELLNNTENGDILISLRSNTPIKDEDSDAEQKKLQEQKKDWQVHTIVIDPGHGGRDPGAIGYGKVYEKNIVLPVGLKLGAEIKKRMPDVKVVYTRKTDIFIPLYKRTKIANESNGKLFVSLHCNSNPNKRARGFETWFLSADKDARAREVVLKENEAISFESSLEQKRYQGVNFVLATMAQNAFIKQSQYFATLVQKSLSKRLTALEMKNRGVKQGPFWVMVGATMPNVLVEMGFISNKNEAKQLQRNATQTKIASAICDGIEKYKKDIEGAM